MKDIRVALWGFGAMGSGIGDMIASKDGLRLSGVCDVSEQLVGKDVYRYLGVERGDHEPLIITDQIEDVVCKDCCDVVILSTDSFVSDQFDKIMFCLDRGVPVISTAEEMAWPWAQHPDLAHRIDDKAKARGVAVLGTGINPGFVLDYLILALTGTCRDVRSIEARRVNDLSPFGRAVMEEQGVGLTKSVFQEKMARGELAGHVGFPESIGMIASGMGVQIDDIEQTREAIYTSVERAAPHGEAKAGEVAGIRQQAIGYTADGRTFIHLDHPQQILPEKEGEKTGDYLTIHADGYDLNVSIVPEIPGGVGTIAMVVNMIPHVLKAKPGLRSMLDLPVPRAILGSYADELTRDEKKRRNEGDEVIVSEVIMPSGKRAPQVPDDTKSVPLIAFTKGKLLEDYAEVGDEVRVKTLAGRTIRGTLTARPIAPQYDYGNVSPELQAVHQQVREILFGGEKHD